MFCRCRALSRWIHSVNAYIYFRPKCCSYHYCLYFNVVILFFLCRYIAHIPSIYFYLCFINITLLVVFFIKLYKSKHNIINQTKLIVLQLSSDDACAKYLRALCSRLCFAGQRRTRKLREKRAIALARQEEPSNYRLLSGVPQRCVARP